MKGKKYTIVITILAAVFLAAFIFVFFYSGFYDKVLIKLGARQEEYWTEERKVLDGWANTMDKLDYEADVVFIGDSLTQKSDFREYFPNLKIVNLGRNGDTIQGITERASMAGAVNPTNIFVLGGINVLRDNNVDGKIGEYSLLLDALKEAAPEANIFVQSVLPVSADVQDTYGIHSAAIEEFNRKLEFLAGEKGCGYVNIYYLYVKDGVMNPEFSEDGIHLKDNEAYKPWAKAIKPMVYTDIAERKNVGNIVDEAKGINDDNVNYALIAWDNMLHQMNYDADVAFIGDSITKIGEFQKYFSDKKVVNLGFGGDTISGLTSRASMVTAMNPEKVFVMAGINSLRDDNIDESVARYGEMLDTLRAAVPDAEIYVQSVLPISQSMQDYLPCHKETVEEFNSRIEELAKEKGMTYIDLYHVYEENGEINPVYSRDGVHPDKDGGYDVWAKSIQGYVYE